MAFNESVGTVVKACGGHMVVCGVSNESVAVPEDKLEAVARLVRNAYLRGHQDKAEMIAEALKVPKEFRAQRFSEVVEQSSESFPGPNVTELIRQAKEEFERHHNITVDAWIALLMEKHGVTDMKDMHLSCQVTGSETVYSLVANK